MAGDTYFIVDYDVPAERRSAFYGYLRRRGVRIGKSTLSVVITRDRGLAELIYSAALRYGGRANIWEARPIVSSSSRIVTLEEVMPRNG